MSNLEKFERIGNEKLPSVINDPFSKVNIINIHVHFHKSYFGEGWAASGTVEFKNGNTKGEQNFEGAHFDEVAEKIREFIKTLN
jgi:hypothetical protein